MTVFFQISVFLSLLQGAPSTAPECQYDRLAMLALDETAFDQDTNGGWRTLAQVNCDAAAANLIAEWRQANNSESTTLYWHEGQMRAFARDYDAAIPLLTSSRKPTDFDAEWGWNLYVDGTVAFLQGDKQALLSSRSKLAALPEPESLKNMKDVYGKPSKVEWPMNLHVLDAYVRCWGQSYKQAYNCPLPATESKRAPEAP